MTWLNWPNRITIARIILVAPLVICLLDLNTGAWQVRRVALGLFVLLALSDALDGFLARRLGEETPLGRFLDPVADKLLIACAVVLLSLEPTAVAGFVLPNWVPVIAIGKELLTTIGFSLVYATTGQFFIKPRICGKLCTLLQSVMVGAVLAAPDLPEVLQRIVPVTWWLASVMAVVAAIDYLRIGNRFAARYHAGSQHKD
jgi:CDP-diacylglycerol--glycerol-3-phosphate 3-phosphatidyltransferase